MGTNGKSHDRRPRFVSRKTYDDNYDRVFGGKAVKPSEKPRRIFSDEANDFDAAWNEFIRELLKAFKIKELADWLVDKLNKIGGK